MASRATESETVVGVLLSSSNQSWKNFLHDNHKRGSNALWDDSFLDIFFRIIIFCLFTTVDKNHPKWAHLFKNAREAMIRSKFVKLCLHFKQL